MYIQINNLDIECSDTKNQTNIEQRGISFELTREFNLDDALTVQDTRHDYKEPRFLSIGFIANRLHVLVFTPRNSVIRVISLRKENPREVKKYEHNQQH